MNGGLLSGKSCARSKAVEYPSSAIKLNCAHLLEYWMAYPDRRKLIRQRSRSIFKGFLENESFDHYEFVSRV